MNMTDAEIKELAIKHGYEELATVRLAYQGFNIASFSKELEAITREKVLAELLSEEGYTNPKVLKWQRDYYKKVLAELVKDNPTAAWEIEGEILAAEENDYPFDVCVKNGCIPLYKMPPVPEGMQLVPIDPTEAMLEVYRTWHREGLQYMDIGIYKAMLAAAPKKG